MHIHNAVLPRKSVVFTHEFLNWQVARCCECAEQNDSSDEGAHQVEARPAAYLPTSPGSLSSHPAANASSRRAFRPISAMNS